MAASSSPKRAFTIVEMLVVITIIGLLLGLLFPALGAVRRKAYKSTEANNLKQVGYAWMMYGNHNNDAALPGYMESDVLQRWRLRYEFPDHVPVPPAAPTWSGPNVAGPWTWRLMQYLDYTHDLVHGYSDDHDASMVGISGDLNEAMEIAEEPSFGYNGYYVGGCWEMVNVSGTDTPRYRFHDHCELNTTKQVTIPTSIGQIRRASELVTFCSSIRITSPGVLTRLPDDTPGGHLVMPPRTDQLLWQVPPATGQQIEIVSINPDFGGGTFVPFGRYTGAAVVLFADGHVDQQMPSALNDPRKWIDSAISRDYQHAACP